MSTSWTIRSSKHSSSVSSLQCDPFETATGDLLVVFAAYRDSGSPTFGAPSVAGATVGSWTHVDTEAILDSGSSRYVRLRISIARVTSGNSSTTVTSSTSSSVFNFVQRVGIATGVEDTPVQSATGTGTSKPASLSFSQATTEGNLALAAIAIIGFDTTTESLEPNTGWTDEGAIGSTSIGLETASRTTATNGVSWDGTGLTSGKAHSQALVELAAEVVTPPSSGAMMMAA